MPDVVEWLLQGEPWVQYRVRVDLLDLPESSREVVQARKALVAHPKIRSLTKDLRELRNTITTNHKTAGHPLHKLVFAAGLGLRADDPGMRPVVKEIVKHRAEKGPFQVLMNIPVHFGGTGRDQWAWALCDSPLLVYALAKFRLADDEPVQEAADYLAGLVRENGWGCTVSPELGKFRVPGARVTRVHLPAWLCFRRWRNYQSGAPAPRAIRVQEHCSGCGANGGNSIRTCYLWARISAS